MEKGLRSKLSVYDDAMDEDFKKELELLEKTKKAREVIQIIGIDLADENSEDFSAISSMCGNCKTIIESKAFANKDNKPQATIFKRCPVCGIEFKKHTIKEYTY